MRPRSEKAPESLGPSSGKPIHSSLRSDTIKRESLRLHGVRTSGGRRRPSGEPPPLPRQLGSSGRYWLVLLGVAVALYVGLVTVSEAGMRLTLMELALLRRISGLRSDLLTPFMQAVHVMGSYALIAALRWGVIVALLLTKRLRHLIVFIGTMLVVGWLTALLSAVFFRARPIGIERLASWSGSAHPSRPMAALAVTLLGIAYTLVIPGRPRQLAKWVFTVLLALFGVAELYLGLAHPIDVLVGMTLGVTVPLIAFRLITPNEVFPVAYRRARAAHLAIDKPRTAAIKKAVQDQLGVTVLEVKPFNLEGSFGSTPLRLRVAGDPERHLFAKLYAASHMRADRWYKLWRTLRYGRLEDERPFSTVRRLVQYEDYLLHVMHRAGLPVAEPYGFVEITPEREYLLVTEFMEGAEESGQAEVDECVVDDALQVVRRLWDAGVAHRDIKPANVMVRDGRVVLIDPAFGEVRPSPWRQAVDLANMMLVLALRCEPELVYSRALQYFSPEEISEAFASTSEATRPSLHRMMRADGRDLLKTFRELAPPRAPIAIQRWSWRRVFLTAGVAFAILVAVFATATNLRSAALFPVPPGTQASFSALVQPPACGGSPSEQLIIEAQAVPSASLLPCLKSEPIGWSFGTLSAQSGSSRFVLNSDRAGVSAVAVTLTADCDTGSASEVLSDEPGTRRYEEIASVSAGYTGNRYYVFKGGCVVYQFAFSGSGSGALANEVTLGLSFSSQADLERKGREVGLLNKSSE